MMINNYRLVVFAAIILGVGCSSGEDKAVPKKTSQEPIFQGQIQALEKAKGVELMLQVEGDKRRKAIEEGSR